MRLLLDAHAFLWAATDDPQLPPAVRDIVEDPRTRVAVSVASIWELVTKAAAGRLRLPDVAERYFPDRLQRLGFDALPVFLRHVLALQELPQIHGDPFDRILVAQALTDDLQLVTGDERLRAYPIKTIW